MINLETLRKECKNKWVVYMITNPAGQKYVGATSNFSGRMNFHRRRPIGYPGLLAKSFSEYGFDSHTVSVLWRGAEKDMFSMEEKLIKKLNTCYLDNPALGLNSRRGNNDNSHLIKKMDLYKRKVHQYDFISGKYIQTFDSIHDAARGTKKPFSYKNISNVCYGKRRMANGYFWSFDKSDAYKPEVSWKKRKPQRIYKVYKDGSVIYDAYGCNSEAASKNYMKSGHMLSAIRLGKIIDDKFLFIKAAQ
jgi:predicted GIY-YIG superfamily endonuclease